MQHGWAQPSSEVDPSLVRKLDSKQLTVHTAEDQPCSLPAQTHGPEAKGLEVTDQSLTPKESKNNFLKPQSP